MKVKRDLISIVLPVFQNEGSIQTIYRLIVSQFNSNLPNFIFEIIYVNDGSTDGSLSEILQIAKKDKRVKVISLTRNFGQVPATLAGYNASKGSAIITLSADLQDPIELFPKIINLYKAGSDVVICHRESRGDGLARKFLSNIVYSILRISNPKIPKGGFDYSLLSRKVMDILLSYGHGIRENGYLYGDYFWSGYPVCYIPYHRKKRPFGKSQLNFSRKVTSFFNMIIDGSYIPIRFISASGFFIAVLGFLYAISILVNWALVSGSAPPFSGWRPIILTILIVGGLNMIMLGIIGEYIWRIYEYSKKKPPYLIDFTIN